MAAQKKQDDPVVIHETLNFSRSCPTGWDYVERTETTVTFRCSHYEEEDQQ